MKLPAPFISLINKRKKRIYLDHAAATPVAAAVEKAMRPWIGTHYGNPSAIHAEGQRARDAIEHARVLLARTLNVRPHGITFTSGGTESNNLAIRGHIAALCAQGMPLEKMKVLTTAIEHPSITNTLKSLETEGVHVEYMPVGEDGRIGTKAFGEMLDEDVVLVTFSYANSEVGVVQDVKRVTRAVRAWNQSHDTQVNVHLDASQTPLWLPCQLDTLGVDMMTQDGVKCGGPMGSGVLAHRHGVGLSPILHGGGQEAGLRAGTENVAGIVGVATAVMRAQEGWEERSVRVTKIRDEFLNLLQASIPEAIVNGSLEHRLPNNINISLPGIDTEFAVVVLDRHGIAASTKSACSGADGSGSEVVRTLSSDESRAQSTIRFTLGEQTTLRELRTTVSVLQKHIAHMKTAL